MKYKLISLLSLQACFLLPAQKTHRTPMRSPLVFLLLSLKPSPPNTLRLLPQLSLPPLNRQRPPCPRWSNSPCKPPPSPRPRPTAATMQLTSAMSPSRMGPPSQQDLPSPRPGRLRTPAHAPGPVHSRSNLHLVHRWAVLQPPSPRQWLPAALSMFPSP